MLAGNYGEAGALVVVGYDRSVLERWFGAVEPAARIDNGVGLDNEDRAAPCGSPVTRGVRGPGCGRRSGPADDRRSSVLAMTARFRS